MTTAVTVFRNSANKQNFRFVTLISLQRNKQIKLRTQTIKKSSSLAGRGNKPRVYLVPQIRIQPRRSRVQAGVLDLLDLVLEESGDVEENRERGNDSDMQTSLSPDGVRVRSCVRTTHGQVAVYGHQHCHIDRTCTTYEHCRLLYIDRNGEIGSDKHAQSCRCYVSIDVGHFVTHIYIKRRH